MQHYKKDIVIGSIAAAFYTLVAMSRSMEGILLQAAFFMIAAFFFRRAYFEQRKLYGKDPSEASRKKKAYWIVGILYGFVIIVFVVSRLHNAP